MDLASRLSPKPQVLKVGMEVGVDMDRCTEVQVIIYDERKGNISPPFVFRK